MRNLKRKNAYFISIVVILIITLFYYIYIDTKQWGSLRQQEEQESIRFKQVCQELESRNIINAFRFTEYHQQNPVYIFVQPAFFGQSLLKQDLLNSGTQSNKNTQKQKVKGTILFILGMLQSIEDAKYIFNELSSQGFNVIVASRRKNIHDIDLLCKDYLYIYDKYSSLFGFEHKLNILIGHSLGGLIGTRIMQIHAHKFNRLILICPFMGLDPHVNILIYENMIRRGFSKIKKLCGAKKSNNLTSKQQSQNIQFNKNNIFPPQTIFHLQNIQKIILQDMSKTQTVQTLLIISENEHLVSNKLALQYMQTLDNNNNQIVLHKNTSHYFAKSRHSFQNLIHDINQFLLI